MQMPVSYLQLTSLPAESNMSKPGESVDDAVCQIMALLFEQAKPGSMTKKWDNITRTAMDQIPN